MAPEVVEGRPYKGTSVDIFALGVTLFAMVTGVMPFERRAHKSDQLYQYLMNQNDFAYWELLQTLYGEEAYFIKVQNLSSSFKKFIVQFLRYNYFERITLSEIQQSAWLNDQDTQMGKSEFT